MTSLCVAHWTTSVCFSASFVNMMSTWMLVLPALLAGAGAGAGGAGGERLRALVVFPFPGRSHSILGWGFCDILAAAGHEVTHITAFPQKENHPNIRQIDVSSFQKMEGVSQVANITAIMEKGNFQHQSLSSFFDLITSIGRSTYLHENVQKLMNDPNEHFDVVIIEYMMSEIGVGLSWVFGCPFIYSSSIDPHSLALSLVDAPLSPAYSPGPFSARVPPFSFADRIKELFSAALLLAYREYYAWTTEEQNYKEIFEPIVSKKGRKLPAFAEARYGAALMLGNSHASLGGAARLPQSYVPVAGYHIGEPAPLPTDLQKIMDSAKNGVIYFSMGSNLKSKYLPETMKRDLLKVFAARKETVIWKFEEDLPDLPKNVYIVNWAPQHSILAHPNCKLFITHGGLLSLTEAIHFGVPLVGIPVFGDQFLNVQRAAQSGYAVHAPLTHTLPQTLTAAIEEVLGHSKYAEKAKELSLIYHDRPCSAAAAARHAVELAVRTRGAAHLRSPALLLPWYQKCYLDFAALLIAVLLTVSLVIKRICRLCFSNKKSSNPKIKNN